MKTYLFFPLALALLTISGCSTTEAHSKGYVISQSQVEEGSSESLSPN